MFEFMQNINHGEGFSFGGGVVFFHIVQEYGSICNWLITFFDRFWAMIALTTKFDMFMWTWNSMSHLGAIKIGASKYLCFMASHAS
jgi:hypothetical protein